MVLLHLSAKFGKPGTLMKSVIVRLFSYKVGCLEVAGLVAVVAAGVDELTLLGRGANAAARAAERRTAAFRLALVIGKHEQLVVVQVGFGAQKGLVGRRATPVAQTVRRLLDHIIVRADRLVLIARRRAIHQIIGKSLRRRVVRKSG